MFTGLNQDIRYAMRGFVKSPLFLLVAVASIGIGVGANAAIFSLMDQILFRPLPIKSPERLVMLDLPGARIGATYTDYAFSNSMYRKLRDASKSFDGLIATYYDRANMSHRGRSETVPVALVSGNYFPTLGLDPALGRVLSTADDEKKNAHPIVVLSYGYFQRRFGGDTSIVGQTIRINSQPYEVVGVAPMGFTGLEMENVPSLYVTLSQKSQITTTWDGMDDPNYYFLHIYGRLKDQLSASTAKANLDSLVGPLIEEEMRAFPNIPAKGQARFRAKRFALAPAATPLVNEKEKVQQALYALFGVVGLVLLIACANVANLLIARASAREKEVAVRLAMGAGTGRLIRQMLVESTLLSLMGGVAGLLASIWILDAILALNPVEAAEEMFFRSKPDWRVAGFCLGISMLTGLLFGLAPAARGAQKMIVDSLKENTGALAASATQAWLRRALVAGQVTISLVLLVAAGLFGKSLLNLKTQNPGFNPNFLLTFRIDASLNGYEKEKAVNFLGRFSKDIEALPGVKDVTIASSALLSNEVSQKTTRVEGISRTEGRNMNNRVNEIGPGYFSTLQIPVILGREFTESDTANSMRVAVVNEAFAKEYFNGNPIGKKIGFGRLKETGGPTHDIEIVGMVRDGKHANLREEKPERFIYTPYTQNQSIESMTFYVRGETSPERLVTDIRAALRRVDENLSIFRIQTMERTIERSLVLERMLSTVCSAFGMVATILAAIGLYGVMAYNVARRTREIGIRLALGADRTQVVELILREAAWMLAIGLVLGLPIAYALGRIIESQLWNVSSGDPLVMALAALGISTVALGAGLIPAWRATKVQPMTALRYE
jgi:predicted permease